MAQKPIDRQRFKRTYPFFKPRQRPEFFDDSEDSGTGGLGLDSNSTFVVITPSGDLPNERVIGAGSGLNGSDGGSGGNYTLSVDPNVIAFLSGCTYTGAVRFNSGLSGSLTKLIDGSSYLVGVGGISITTGSNGQIFISGSSSSSTSSPSGGGGDPGAQYLVLSSTASLSNERAFVAGAGLAGLDDGADSTYTLGIDNNVVATVSGTTFTGVVSAGNGLSGSLQRTTAGLSYLVGVGGISITSQSNGQILISGSTGGSGGGAPTSAQYLTLASDATLSAERTFTPGTGLLGADGGANGTFTLGIDNNMVATTTGSTFSGVTKHTAGLSGSLTQLSDGRSFIVGVGGTSILSQSNGQVLVSSSLFAPREASYVTVASDSTLTSERALTAGTGLLATDGGAGSTYTLGINNNVVATISGSTFSGVTTHSAGLSGSLTRLPDGRSFLVAVGGIQITSQSNGQILISGSGGGSGGGAPTDAQYLVLSPHATLSDERAFVKGTGLTSTDGGSGNNYTLAIDNNVVATVSGTRFTGPVTGSVGISGSVLQANQYVTVGTNPGSTGQLRLSSNVGGTAGVFSSGMRLIADDGSGNVKVGDEINSSVVNVFGSSNVNLGSGNDTHLIAGAFAGGVRVQTWLKLADTDNDAVFIFSASNLAPGADKGVILPALSASSDTFVFEQQAQTLTNKTFSAPTLSNPTITGGGSWAGSPSITSPSISSPTITGTGTAALTTLTLGSPAAASGSLRLTNQAAINWRNGTNAADIQGLFVSNLNHLYVGTGSNTGDLYLQGGTGRTNYHQAASHTFRNVLGTTTYASLGKLDSDHLSLGYSPATTGSLRLTKGGKITVRDTANTGTITLMNTSLGADYLYVGGDDFFMSNGPSIAWVGALQELWLGYQSSVLKIDSVGASIVNASFNLTQGTKATQGMIRFGQSQAGIFSRNNGNTADVAWIADNNGDLIIGKDTANASQSPTTSVNASTTLKLQTNATDRLSFTTTAATFSTQVTASMGISGSFGHLVSGSVSTDHTPMGRFVDPATCGHRLTVTSGTSHLTSDVSSASTLYLAPYVSDRIALYDGTRWVERHTSNGQVSIALSALTSGANYDVFAYDNSGTVTLELGSAWTNNTTRSQALTRRDGVLVKSGAETRKYLGTIRTTGTTTTADTATQRFVWNHYNRLERDMLVTDTTATWAYVNPNGVYRQARSTASNAFEYVCGEPVRLHVRVVCFASQVSGAATTFSLGVGIDSTTSNSAQIRAGRLFSGDIDEGNAEYRGVPSAGYHKVNWLETGLSNAVTYTFYGNQANMCQSGMSAVILG